MAEFTFDEGFDYANEAAFYEVWTAGERNGDQTFSPSPRYEVTYQSSTLHESAPAEDRLDYKTWDDAYIHTAYFDTLYNSSPFGMGPGSGFGVWSIWISQGMGDTGIQIEVYQWYGYAQNEGNICTTINCFIKNNGTLVSSDSIDLEYYTSPTVSVQYSGGEWSIGAYSSGEFSYNFDVEATTTPESWELNTIRLFTGRATLEHLAPTTFRLYNMIIVGEEEEEGGGGGTRPYYTPNLSGNFKQSRTVFKPR